MTYHESCHLKRGLGVSEPPRKLLRGIPGVEFVEIVITSYSIHYTKLYDYLAE